MRYALKVSVFLIFFFASFSSAFAQPKGKTISQFERAGLCDFLIDKSGLYHVVFRESPAIGKPMFIYYSVSSNKGASWSKPVTISNDNTGNGSGYPRILQDGNGMIYAIWKRYGTKASQYPVPDVLLDGPGGYTLGTLFYKVLNGGGWSEPVQLNEVEASQVSRTTTVTPTGKVAVFWTQLSPESIKSKQNYWYYCDFFRTTTLNGTGYAAITNMNTPAPPAYAGGAPAQKGAQNLDGYVDKNGSPHLIYEDKSAEGVKQIKYYDGKTQRIAYSYPKYGEGNTFNYPAKLLTDENGTDHLVFRPASSVLESEEIWDINLATDQKNVLLSIQQPRVKIYGFQAKQGPRGAMAVTVEAGTMSGNTEAFGLFYQNGVWKNVGLTNNAAKEKFFHKEFKGLGGYNTSLSTLTRYNSTFNSIAWDAAGKKSMAMTISAYWSTGGYSTSSPSLVFSPIDK